MKHHEFDALTKAMETYGGSFVKSFAKTLRHADPVNRELLLKGLPAITKHYTALANLEVQPITKLPTP